MRALASVALVLAGLWACGSDDVPSDASVPPDVPRPDVPLPARVNAEVLAPVVALAGDLVPMWFRVTDPNPERVSGNVTVALGDGTYPPYPFPLRFGWGAAVDVARFGLGSITSAELVLAPRTVRVVLASDRTVTGVAGGPTWGPGELVDVTGDLTIPPGETLTVQAGTTVRIAMNANVLVQGTLVVAGTASEPVAFISADGGRPWGGFSVAGTASFSHALLTGGGGDFTRTFGHSNSQPVLFADVGGRIVLEDSLIADCTGKALGAQNAHFEVRRSLVTTTDTGGEMVQSETLIEASHFTDFPAVGAPAADDDNDGIYFRGSLMVAGVPQVSRVLDSVFFAGLDDGIDHNGATLEIERTWIEGFAHEGVAGSNGGSVSVVDTVFARNGQGLEAGYGAPTVTADHVLFVENGVGARYGDSYDWTYDGTLTVSNSVFVSNIDHQLWNFLFSTGAPKPGAITLTSSVVPGGYAGMGIVDATPQLTDDLLLVPGSSGTGAASDGTDMGLRTARAGH